MDLLSLVIMLVFIGVGLHLLNRYAGAYIDGTMLHIINMIVILAVVLYIFSLFFRVDIPHFHIGR